MIGCIHEKEGINRLHSYRKKSGPKKNERFH